MKRPNNIVFIILCCISLFSVNTNAQNTIVYSYDDNGNRQNRVLSAKKSAKADFPIAENNIRLQEKLSDEESRIKIYPNPTSGILKISLENYTEQIKGEFRVYNLNGRLLKHSRIHSALTDVNLSDVSNGVYILRLIINGKPFDYKVIKQNY